MRRVYTLSSVLFDCSNVDNALECCQCVKFDCRTFITLELGKMESTGSLLTVIVFTFMHTLKIVFGILKKSPCVCELTLNFQT